MSAADSPTVITTYSETSYPEGPSASGIFTSQEILAFPEYLWWIQLGFLLMAAAFALATFVRERSWSSALMCLACCCYAAYGAPMVLSTLFPNSEDVMRLCLKVSLPLMYVQILAAPLLAGSLILRWRGARR
jgi:hypothetical protein